MGNRTNPIAGYFQDTEMIRRVVTEQDGRLYYADWLNAAFGVLVLLGTVSMVVLITHAGLDARAAALSVWIPIAAVALGLAAITSVRRILHQSFPLFAQRFRKFALTEIGVYLVIGALVALLWASNAVRPGAPLLLIAPHLFLLGFYTVGTLHYTAFAVIAVAFGLLALAPPTLSIMAVDGVIAAGVLIISSIQMSRA